MTSRLAEFPKGVKELAAQRAGYHCSLPKCRQATAGPAGKGASASIGQAAHIYSASPKGPRGSGGLSLAALRAQENAIWCCGKHGSLIDAVGGVDYLPKTLAGYKRLAEARAAVELRGKKPPGVGWFFGLELESAPRIAADEQLELGQLTAVVGPNGVGKTLVGDCFAGISARDRWNRWRDAANTVPLSFRVDYFDPEPHDLTVTITGDNTTWVRDGASRVVVPLPVQVIRHSMTETPTLPSKYSRYHKDTVGFLAKAVGVTKATLQSVLPLPETPVSFAVQTVDGDSLDVMIPGSDGVHKRSYGVLSVTEQRRTRLSIVLSVCEEMAKLHPTLLVLDDFGYIFDEGWRRAVLDDLGTDRGFQILGSFLSDDDLDEWQVIRMREEADGTHLLRT